MGLHRRFSPHPAARRKSENPYQRSHRLQARSIPDRKRRSSSRLSLRRRFLSNQRIRRPRRQFRQTRQNRASHRARPVPAQRETKGRFLSRQLRSTSALLKHLISTASGASGLLRSYSTLDIAGAPDNVAASISHYTVFRDVEGFVTADGKTVFRMTTVDNRRLTFDPGTGNLLEKTDIAGAKAPAHE